MTQNAVRAKQDDTTRSPLRTVHILHTLARCPAGVSLASLSTVLDLPKTSLFRLLKSLEAGDYVSAQAGLYTLGPAAFKLGAAIVQNREFPNCARPVMQSIAHECGETVILGTLADSRSEVFYAEVIEATQPLRYISKAGSTNPLYGSASGQVLLAAMPAEALAQYLEHTPLLRRAPGTITSAEELLRKLDRIRAAGHSESLEGLVEGVFSVAAPVLDGQGAVIAGLSISTPSSRGLRMADTLSGLALRGAEDISRILGYAGAYPAFRLGGAAP